MTTKKPARKTTRQLAKAKGAKSEADFWVFAYLVKGLKRLKMQLVRLEGWTRQHARLQVMRDELFLKRGRFFQPQPLPKGYRLKKAKDCYSNSYEMTLDSYGRRSADGQLAYCEGLVLTKLGTTYDIIEHGWCATPDGWVIDATWRKPGLVYLGVSYTVKQMAGVDCLPIFHQTIQSKLRGKGRPPSSESSQSKRPPT